MCRSTAAAAPAYMPCAVFQPDVWPCCSPTLTYVLQSDFDVRLELASGTDSLPARAINVQNGRVASLAVVSGSNGRLYDAGISADPQAQSVTVATAAGVTVASGLALAKSNSIVVSIVPAMPLVSVSWLFCKLECCDVCRPVTAATDILLAGMLRASGLFNTVGLLPHVGFCHSV